MPEKAALFYRLVDGFDAYVVDIQAFTFRVVQISADLHAEFGCIGGSTEDLAAEDIHVALGLVLIGGRADGIGI